MSWCFYLSYARLDRGRFVERFFEDLSKAVRSELGLSNYTAVGFINRHDAPESVRSQVAVEQALKTSRTMVALLSPGYFQTDYMAKEWQVFQKRIQVDDRQKPSISTERSDTLVLPIIWIPWDDTPTSLVSKAACYIGNPDNIYNSAGMLYFMRSATLLEYGEVIKAIVHRILNNLKEGGLPPPRSAMPDTPLTYSTVIQPEPPSEKPRAFVIDDQEVVRNVLVETLLFSDFVAHGFDAAEPALAQALGESKQRGMPDLFVVDLQLGSGQMQGIDLIKELNERNVPSAIIAITGHGELEEAARLGAVAVSKPFNLFELIGKMKDAATWGRNQRLYRQGLLKTSDPSRRNRPVFLSYSTEDKTTATGLRRNIEFQGFGVWYDKDTIPPGHDWRNEITKGIDEARVFIALISGSYVASPPCIGELIRFYHRKKADPQLVLIPVMLDSSEELQEDHRIKPILKDHFVDLSRHYLDGLTVLLTSIERALIR